LYKFKESQINQVQLLGQCFLVPSMWFLNINTIGRKFVSEDFFSYPQL